MTDDAFLTDKQIAERWGVSENTGRAAIHALERHPLFPRRDPLFGKKRFWPAVQEFMRWRAGMRPGLPPIPDGPETFEKDPARARAEKRWKTGPLTST